MSEETDPNKEHWEPQPVHQVSLDEHLTTQLNDKNIEEKQKLLVTFLIGSLEPDGYLRLPLKTSRTILAYRKSRSKRRSR